MKYLIFHPESGKGIYFRDYIRNKKSNLILNLRIMVRPYKYIAYLEVLILNFFLILLAFDHRNWGHRYRLARYFIWSKKGLA